MNEIFNSKSYPMLSVKDAEALILELVQPLDGQQDQESLDLIVAGGRVLAAPIRSDRDFPYWDNSAMDGYAVRAEDLQAANPQQPVSLEIIEEIPAGYQPQRAIRSGQAARIFTGAVMPPGADTVVMQEQTQRQGNQVQILATPEAQAHIRERGAFYQAGESLLPQGIVLNAPELAVLATLQCVQIPVYRRPRVAILSTGSELVAPDQPLYPGQIVDSNQLALARLVSESGAVPQCLGTVGDRPELLKAAITQALDSADLIISSGGVSVGDYDYVDQVLEDLGAEIVIRSVAVKPGKPLTVAIFGSSKNQEPPRLYFGLPGNPVSALVSFWRFVQPALKKLAGQAHSWGPAFVQATCRQDLRADGQRETYLWGRLELSGGVYTFKPATGGYSSGNLINLAQTNGLAVLPIEHPFVAAGEPVQVLQTAPAVLSP